VKIAFLAQSNHFLHVRTHRLGLGPGGVYAVFEDKGRGQGAQQGAAMAGVPSEFESCIAMAHSAFSLLKQMSFLRFQVRDLTAVD
jgi:hypothetical protein